MSIEKLIRESRKVIDRSAAVLDAVGERAATSDGVPRPVPHKLAPLMSSKDSGWCTPLEVLEPLREIGTIALDPCSNADSIVGAVRSISLPEDGLVAEWACNRFEIIYCNPPYGREIAPWVAKCAAVGTEPDGHNVVALLPARTDTKWWQRHVSQANAICFWRGRLHFSGGGAAPFPSALVLWTWRQHSIGAAFRVVFEEYGHVMVPR